MPNPGRVDVKLQFGAISDLFGQTSDCKDFGLRTVRQIGVQATLTAPKRSGNLAYSHSTTGWLKSGKYAGRTSVINTAKYAAAVHDGVNHRILPKNGEWLVIRGLARQTKKSRAIGDARVAGKVWKKSVRGQKANPWLQRAANSVLGK